MPSNQQKYNIYIKYETKQLVMVIQGEWLHFQGKQLYHCLKRGELLKTTEFALPLGSKF